MGTFPSRIFQISMLNTKKNGFTATTIEVSNHSKKKPLLSSGHLFLVWIFWIKSSGLLRKYAFSSLTPHFQVYLLHDQVGRFDGLIPNIFERSRPIDAVSDALILSDDSILNDIDIVLYCTGYLYDFPFFNHPESPSLEVKHNGKVVSPLFEHVAHVDYLHSLFFIGLHTTSIFTMCEHQVRFALALAVGQGRGLEEEDVKNWEAKRFR